MLCAVFTENFLAGKEVRQPNMREAEHYLCSFLSFLASVSYCAQLA